MVVNLGGIFGNDKLGNVVRQIAERTHRQLVCRRGVKARNARKIDFGDVLCKIAFFDGQQLAVRLRAENGRTAKITDDTDHQHQSDDDAGHAGAFAHIGAVFGSCKQFGGKNGKP